MIVYGLLVEADSTFVICVSKGEVHGRTMNRSNKIIDVARNKRCYGGILFVFVYSFGCWPRNIFFVKWGWWWLDIVLVSFIRWCTICFAFLQRGFLSYSSYFISFFKIFIKEEKNSLIHTLTHLCGKSLTLLITIFWIV